MDEKHILYTNQTNCQVTLDGIKERIALKWEMMEKNKAKIWQNNRKKWKEKMKFERRQQNEKRKEKAH